MTDAFPRPYDLGATGSAQLRRPGDYAVLLKTLARGPHGSRSLPFEDLVALFTDALAGTMPDGVMGGLLVALRMKGETTHELQAFDTACAPHVIPLASPSSTGTLPVVIGSYNGARRLPNLLPLLALLLARLGLPVLIHGIAQSKGRVTTAEILGVLGHPPARTCREAETALAARRIAFVPVETLAPGLARVLAWRDVLGVRSIAHSHAKTLTPFTAPSLCLAGVTHAPYRDMLREFFGLNGRDALVLRGSEGECIASPQRLPPVAWCRAGQVTELEGLHAAPPPSPCAVDAPATAAFIARAMDDMSRVPATLLKQLEIILIAAGAAEDPVAARTRLRSAFPCGRASCP